jgi:hypothetical protein
MRASAQNICVGLYVESKIRASLKRKKAENTECHGQGTCSQPPSQLLAWDKMFHGTVCVLAQAGNRAHGFL